MSNDEQHLVQTEDRVRYTQLIIQSPARNKVIVAGPGIGKSFMDVVTAEVKPGDGHFLCQQNPLHLVERNLVIRPVIQL